MRDLRRMQITLAFMGAAGWTAYSAMGEACREGSGPTIDDAFAALFTAMGRSENGIQVDHVFDHQNSQPGLYRIVVRQKGDGGLTVSSPDVLGLSYDGDNAEEVMLQLPERVRTILGEQAAYRKNT